MDKIFQKVMMYGVAIFFFISLFWILSGTGYDNIYRKSPMMDELFYKDITNNFTIDNIKYKYNNVLETKPLPFLLLEYTLKANIYYTRLLNIILVLINTILIYKITQNKISFLYPLLIVFLNSMWLTTETIEVMFILLGLFYKEKQGIFTGLAMIFRPYAALYSVLLSKKQFLNFILIGIIFSVILLLLGLFFPYLHEVTNYYVDYYNEIDFLAIVMLFMLFIMGARNKTMLKFALIALIPLYYRLNAHYFIPIYTFLFVGFILSVNEDLKEFKIT